MRNLKNFNYWIAELRDIAIKNKVFAEGDDKPMNKQEVDYIFNKFNFEDRFLSGSTPQEAFDDETESWIDNQ